MATPMQTLKSATITAERLRIRPITLEDAEFIWDMRSKREIYKWTIAGQWTDKKQAKEWITTSLGNQNGFNYIIELIAPDMPPSYFTPPSLLASLPPPSSSVEPMPRKPIPIGSLGSPRPGEVGYMFHPDFWGQGYATEALKGFLARYYEVLGRELGGTMTGHTDSENVGSMRVLLKCGFVEVRREGWDNVTLGRRESVVFEFVPKDVEG